MTEAERLKELVKLFPCPTCEGEGIIEINEPNEIKFGKNAGTIEVDVKKCPDCKGRGTQEE